MRKLILKFDIPVFSISCIILSILLSPFLTIGHLQLWQIVPLVVIVLNLNRLIIYFRRNILFFYFYFYTIIMFFVNILFDQGNFFGVLLKQLLFTSSFFCFLLILSYEEYFKLNFNKLIRLLNVLIIIVCVYGIYQSIGRILHLPFTGDEYLRFRPNKIAGLYQISSFFEEPAFFTQFLICALFIHLLVIDEKHKKIILLIFINLLLTISLSAYFSIFFISFLWLFKSKIVNDLSRLKIKKYILSSLFIFLVIIILLLNTDLLKKNIERISSLVKIENFKSKKVTGDVSGKVRIFGEIETIKKVFQSNKYLFGYGLNFAKYLPNRTMALNAITELLMRWGVLGVIIILVAFFFELLNNRANFFFLLFFLILYFVIDGAIAKASFWTFIGLVFLFNRIRHFQISSCK